ncbi:MAG: NAD(P)-dependent oxidoreductase [Hyphomicrobiales bacterium]
MRYERVAVTGGAGRLGRHVVGALAGRCEVVVLDRAHTDQAASLVVDVMDADAVHRALKGCDAVVHLAGIDLDTTVPPEEYVRVNALGTYTVLEAARANGVKRVITCSSVTATGLNEARRDWPPLYLPVDEDHPLNPVHGYGISKRMAESAAQSFMGAMDVIVLRPMLVMFASNLAHVRRQREAATRWLYYYIAPDDAGRAFHAALEAPKGTNGTFFVTAADTCHEEPTLDWLARSLGPLPEVRDRAWFRDNPRASVFDGRRARDALGFEPTSDWITLSKSLQEVST